MDKGQKQLFHNKKQIASKCENMFTLTTQANADKTVMRAYVLLVNSVKCKLYVCIGVCVSLREKEGERGVCGNEGMGKGLSLGAC